MDTGFTVAELCGMSGEHISARAAPGANGVPGLTRRGHGLCTVLRAPPPHPYWALSDWKSPPPHLQTHASS